MWFMLAHELFFVSSCMVGLLFCFLCFSRHFYSSHSRYRCGKSALYFFWILFFLRHLHLLKIGIHFRVSVFQFFDEQRGIKKHSFYKEVADLQPLDKTIIPSWSFPDFQVFRSFTEINKNIVDIKLSSSYLQWNLYCFQVFHASSHPVLSSRNLAENRNTPRIVI